MIRHYSRMWPLVGVAALLLVLVATSPVLAQLDPDLIEVVASPGESFGEEKVLTLTGVVPRADVLFSFDLTGSMGETIDAARAAAMDIMNDLDFLIADAQYGVISYMDYAGYFEGCGYANEYGTLEYDCGDYPYNLDVPLTSDRVAVANMINGLVLGCGSDGPQDYTRIFYESYADSAIGYREGSKRLLVNFADCVPHDCDLDEGVGVPYPWGPSTGPDPGRDAIVGTPDDLDLQTVLSEMNANGVSLLEVHSEWNCEGVEHWQYWTELTGGGFWLLSGAEEVPAAIQALVEAQVTEISLLTLEVCTPGFEGWLTAVDPPQYVDVVAPAMVPFDVSLTVPDGTPPGMYEFQLCAVGDGAIWGEQTVRVTVPEPYVAIDIKPQSCPNPLNVKQSELISPASASSSVIPVAILGTDMFNVYDIDPATIMFAGLEPLRWEFADVATPVMDNPDEDCECTTEGPDGLMDMTLKFSKAELIAAFDSLTNGDNVTLTIRGMKYDGAAFLGSDCMLIRLSRGGRGTPASAESRDVTDEPLVRSVINFPNPFNAATVISYELTDAAHVSIGVYNILGQNVKTLVDGERGAGSHAETWDGTNHSGRGVASGMYFYRVQVGTEVVTRKMSLLK